MSNILFALQFLNGLLGNNMPSQQQQQQQHLQQLEQQQIYNC